ncbi:hypothetical protein DFH27DRAFT_566366 [Peziza echinospora]|nr:hypothetical protein DFH27DRAFT_566366 [Peziza echinospora]
MKKRGKVPNEYTYTTLISGLAEPQNALYPSTLPRALATYNTLKENSAKGNMGVKLNIKHTNAMLKVCSRTGALDTMWEVVGSLPERGVAAADAMTYTTFLNGLRTLAAPLVTEPVAAAMDWSDEGIAVSSPRPKTIRSTAPEDIVEDAKRLWAGLLTRWTKGDFILDEQLISAMGRLLLSSPRDTDLHSVFDMIHTIYKIPNFFLESTAEAKEAEDAAIESATSAYKPLVAPRASNSTLSLLIETAAQLRAPIAVGDSYVKYFTETLHVQMDVENYHSYLRLLRMFREAKLATELIEKMAAPFLPKPTAKEVEDASSLPTESPAAKKSVAHSSSPIISSPPTTKAFMLALSACRRKGGRVAFYPSALRILDIFDKMPLPPPPHGNNVHQRPYITTDIPKVYTAFLDLALFHGDPQTLKHALKRVTTIPTERSGAVPALPVLLSKKSTRTDDVMYFAKTILQLAQTLLHGSDAGWGHGERTALKENFEMLREMVNNGWNLSDGKGEGSVPVWKEAATWGEARAGPIREEPVHLTKSEKLALKEKKREAWKLKMATNNAAFVAGLKRGKDAGAAGGEKEHGEAAEDWAPSSARDRGAKQFSRPLNGGAQEAYVARSRILAEVGKSREEWGERRPAYTPRSSEGRSWPRESAPREERPRREYAPRGGEERRQSSSFDRPSRDSRGGDRESPRSFDRPRGGDRERPSFDRPSRDSRGGDRDRPSSSSFDRRAPPPAEKHPLAGGSAGPSSWGTGRPQRTFASAPSSSYTRDRDSGDKYFSR